jgi:hypothetical protein
MPLALCPSSADAAVAEVAGLLAGLVHGVPHASLATVASGLALNVAAGGHARRSGALNSVPVAFGIVRAGGGSVVAVLAELLASVLIAAPLTHASSTGAEAAGGGIQHIARSAADALKLIPHAASVSSATPLIEVGSLAVVDAKVLGRQPHASGIAVATGFTSAEGHGQDVVALAAVLANLLRVVPLASLVTVSGIAG